MQVPPPEPCDFTSRLVSFATQDDVPPQMENEIFIVDVQGITDEQRTEILARAELLDFDSSSLSIRSLRFARPVRRLSMVET